MYSMSWSSGSPSWRFTLPSKARSSSASNALPRLSMGMRCSTVANSSRGGAPTRWVGESGVTNAGYCDSRPSNSRISRSYSASLTSGASST